MDDSIVADDDTAHRAGESAEFWPSIPTTNAPPPSFPPVCEQCINWKPAQTVVTGFGIQTHGGFCAARAAADLFQMHPSYAAKCRLFVEEVPF